MGSLIDDARRPFRSPYDGALITSPPVINLFSLASVAMRLQNKAMKDVTESWLSVRVSETFDDCLVGNDG